MLLYSDYETDQHHVKWNLKKVHSRRKKVLHLKDGVKSRIRNRLPETFQSKMQLFLHQPSKGFTTTASQNVADAFSS